MAHSSHSLLPTHSVTDRSVPPTSRFKQPQPIFSVWTQLDMVYFLENASVDAAECNNGCEEGTMCIETRRGRTRLIR